MSTQVVVDAGVILATLFEEPHSQHAKAIMAHWAQEEVELHAPVLFRYETLAAVRKAVFQTRLEHDKSYALINTLLALNIVYHLDEMLLRRAYDLASQLNAPRTYDAQYVALAERLSCELWTADERLYNAAHDSFSWVKWIGQKLQ